MVVRQRGVTSHCLRRQLLLALVELDGDQEMFFPGRAGVGRWCACPRPCRASVFCNVTCMMAKCCCDGGVTHYSQLGLNSSRWVEVGDVTDENLARLRSVLATTAPVGVIFLLGGIAMVCRHLPLLVWIVVPGRKPRSSWTGDGGISASFLGWEHHAWRHGLKAL
ncbi:hypothetical protein VPH35_011827 [Triticum aestivum]